MQKLNMQAAMKLLEVQAARQRDYQTANICKATAEYIDALEKEIAELKQAEQDKEEGGEDAVVRDAGGDGEANGAVA